MFQFTGPCHITKITQSNLWLCLQSLYKGQGSEWVNISSNTKQETKPETQHFVPSLLQCQVGYKKPEGDTTTLTAQDPQNVLGSKEDPISKEKILFK